ncbi:hypothetical protein GCM10022226_62550 [Sphaerisporangium flaviroseum]|uniref:Uncharacterized protein n=1 Tax=Sphaerisporangium flaviroseum TaxID=509199 RepID=A0ABP7J305_9ACTN
MTDPLETLDLKRLYIEYLGSPFAREIAAMSTESYQKQGVDNSCEAERDSLMHAQNFWVAPDMVSIVEAAQETMPDEEVLLEEPPSPHGFLILGRHFTSRCSDPECAEDHEFCGVYWRPVHRVTRQRLRRGTTRRRPTDQLALPYPT